MLHTPSQPTPPESQSAAKSSRTHSLATIFSGIALIASLLALGFNLLALNPLNLGQNRDELLDKLSHPLNERYELVENSSGKGRDFAIMGGNPSLLADVAEQVAPAVVNIDVEKTRSVRSLTAPDIQGFPFGGDEMLRDFFKFQGGQQMVPRTITGNGSGIVLDKEGHVLTNNHVVSSADKITVTLNDGRKYPANLIGRDQFSDLAVLKITAPNLKPAHLGESNKLRPGEWVLAIGSPLGFDHTVTLGIISAISRRVPDINSNVDFLQTDAAINPGNSGGPLVNLHGEVIGINTAISGNGQNIGFAIPVDVARSVAKDLIAEGKITRPWIGLAMAEISPDLAKSLGLPENTTGVVVAQVLPTSPAERAGFHQGDIIQHIDGQKVKDAKRVQELVRAKTIGSPLNIQILRDGQMRALTLKTEQLPDNALEKKPAQAPSNQGPSRGIPFFGQPEE